MTPPPVKCFSFSILLQWKRFNEKLYLILYIYSLSILSRPECERQIALGFSFALRFDLSHNCEVHPVQNPQGH